MGMPIKSSMKEVYAWAFLVSAIIFEVTSNSVSKLASDYYDYEDEDDDLDIQEQITTTTEMVKFKPLGFTYGDNDAFGPNHWRNKKILLEEIIKAAPTIKSQQRSLLLRNNVQTNSILSTEVKKFYENNYCQTNWISPINIQTENVRIVEIDTKDTSSSSEIEKLLKQETAGIPETLIITISVPNIQNIVWTFGHPTRYHGIEIRSSTSGTFQLMDNFDPIRLTNSFTAYDFDFLTLFYCDIERALPHRTMHQIDGQRFPLELEYVFLRRITDEERSRMNLNAEEEYDEMGDAPAPLSTLIDGQYVAVIISVIGEIGPTDNKYFQPIVEAAKRFHGSDFNENNFDSEEEVSIDSPWSPTWLLPDSSDYYYYDDGSFPVPPCWTVARYYIMKERFKISPLQLDMLTRIRTEREKGTRKMLPCTHSTSLLHRDALLSGETVVNLNLIDYEIQGENDGKPRSPVEVKQRNERKRKREVFRKRLTGKGDGSDLADETGEGVSRRVANFVTVMLPVSFHYFC